MKMQVRDLSHVTITDDHRVFRRMYKKYENPVVFNSASSCRLQYEWARLG